MKSAVSNPPGLDTNVCKTNNNNALCELLQMKKVAVSLILEKKTVKMG